MEHYLKPTYYLNFEHKKIQNLIHEFKGLSAIDKITGLYLKVRDGWRYNAYQISFQADDYRASEIASHEQGHCVDKAILYTAGLRALNIPARLHLAKVANHIAVDRLIEVLGKNELTPHGMVDVFHNGKWTKATPAFNKELCDLFQVEPLDFNGSEDAIFQQFNKEGALFMEYLEDYGSFEDVPVEFMVKKIEENYPEFYRKNSKVGKVSI